MLVVPDERLGVHGHVVRIGEALVAARHLVVDVRRGGVPARRRAVAVRSVPCRRGRRRLRGSASSDASQCSRAGRRSSADGSAASASRAERRACRPPRAARTGTRRRLGASASGWVSARCRSSAAASAGSGASVDPGDEGPVVGAARISSKNCSSAGMRHLLEAERRLAHLAHARAQRRDVLGAEIRVMAEGRLQLVERFGRDARVEDAVQPLERVVEPLQPADALVDREAGPGGLLDGAQPGERGNRGHVRNIAESSDGRLRAGAASGLSYLRRSVGRRWGHPRSGIPVVSS